MNGKSKTDNTHYKAVKPIIHRSKQKINGKLRDGLISTTTENIVGNFDPSDPEELIKYVEYCEDAARHEAQKHGFSSTLDTVEITDQNGRRTGSKQAGFGAEPTTPLYFAYLIEQACSDLRRLLEKLSETDNSKRDVYRVAFQICLLYTSPSPRDQRGSRMPSSA